MSDVCIVGRCHFNSGIGKVTLGAILSLRRFFDVSIFPLEHHLRSNKKIYLPSGGEIDICHDLSRAKVVFFTDVLWNGAADLNYQLLPNGAFKIAHIAWDSDEFPVKWVDLLNEKFNLALFTSRHLERMAKAEGVNISVGTLPVALEIDGLISESVRFRESERVTFGTISSFHPRKGVDVLVRSFIRTFRGQKKSARLILHSNVKHEAFHGKILDLIEDHPDYDIQISYGDLSERNKNSLIASFDVYASLSQGEGYSIGPREALAMGKTIVLSNIAAHRDLIGVEGVFSASATKRVVARYPEIDNLIFGSQYQVEDVDADDGLIAAYEHVSSGKAQIQAAGRKQHAMNFGVEVLAANYAELINPWIRQCKSRLPSSRFFHLQEGRNCGIEPFVGYYMRNMKNSGRIIVPAHDGGFFSVFNGFFSNFVWNERIHRKQMTLPDWDVGRLLARNGDKGLVSFCYAAPGEGNVWSKLFKPLYGLSSDDLDDVEFLYSGAAVEIDTFNGRREPNLTYINAARLYQSRDFHKIRRMYNSIFLEFIEFDDEIKSDVQKFVSNFFDGKYVVAAHVKHPSHVIEQPGGIIAGTDEYILDIENHLREMGIWSDASAWVVFLATDQDIVVEKFRKSFDGNVCFYSDVRRTTIEEDAHYLSLSDESRRSEGFQVQHRVALDSKNWSSRMAVEVVRDAATMARSNILFHVVSNVSTAVAYMNPEVEMKFSRGKR
jgi:glycosyltransferase involved in cell wall biosynthesis